MQNGPTHDEPSNSQSEKLMADPGTKWLQSLLGIKEKQQFKNFKVKKLVLSDIKLHF